jgi:dTDP-4-amino-4,6-dideoxygalactose transaminase
MKDSNPFKAVAEFEKVMAEYAGSKYGVAVDSCTNALFLACKYVGIEGQEVILPSRTYPSVPCSVIHAGGKVKFKNYKWEGVYRLDPFPIVDGAKRMTSGMYEKGTFHCISFHIKKHLPIGRGGMILTDDEEAVKWFKQARFDGRHECSLAEDKFEMLGWNFYMNPEQASRGLWLMMMIEEHNHDIPEDPPYPDLSEYKIYTEANR